LETVNDNDEDEEDDVTASIATSDAVIGRTHSPTVVDENIRMHTNEESEVNGVNVSVEFAAGLSAQGAQVHQSSAPNVTTVSTIESDVSGSKPLTSPKALSRHSSFRSVEESNASVSVLSEKDAFLIKSNAPEPPRTDSSLKDGVVKQSSATSTGITIVILSLYRLISSHHCRKLVPITPQIISVYKTVEIGDSVEAIMDPHIENIEPPNNDLGASGSSPISSGRVRRRKLSGTISKFCLIM
jgi:hypothetical protein